MSSPIVFFDIAGPDSDTLSSFYAALFDWEISPDGSVSVDVKSATEVSPSLLGTIRKDPKEKMLYIGVDNVATKLAQIVEHGGEIDQARFEVPGLVVLGLFRDPAGNRMGLVEMEDGQVKVP